MTVIKRIVFFFEKTAYWFLITAIGVMTLVTLIEVVRRYLFGLSFTWSEELVRYLLIWSTFIGGSLAYKKKAVVYFDLFINKLSFKKRKLADIGINGFIIFISVVIFILGLRTLGTKTVQLQISPGLKISMEYIYMSIPIGMVFLFVFAIDRIMEIIRSEESL